MQSEIQTDRLRLIALTQEQLSLALNQPEQLEAMLGFFLSRSIFTEPLRRAITLKLAKMSQAPQEDHLWFTYWLIVPLDEPFGAGMAGFKGSPDKQGEVEIGYGIDPVCQGKGYMTETARLLIAWAFQSPHCRAVIAPGTLKSNLASNRVLEKAGMHLFAETEDTLSWRIDKPLAPPR